MLVKVARMYSPWPELINLSDFSKHILKRVKVKVYRGSETRVSTVLTSSCCTHERGRNPGSGLPDVRGRAC